MMPVEFPVRDTILLLEDHRDSPLSNIASIHLPTYSVNAGCCGSS